jgi:SagB-type dehydrogenase family enzyme
LEKSRIFLGADEWKNWDEIRTDQKSGIASPAIQRSPPDASGIIDLVPPGKITVGRMPLFEAISRRRSHRAFTGEDLSLEELSFLLWASQGIQWVVGTQGANLRTAPSGGGRHPFETYLAVLNVAGLDPGLYWYDALNHTLLRMRRDALIDSAVLAQGCRNQRYFDRASVAFIWTAVPYRTVWRYADLSPKTIAQDSGHMCENLYLAATAIGAGTCAIGAYYQDFMDELLGVDGEDEFVIYIAPVGRVRTGEQLDHEGQFRVKYST